jgi:hypothetical protein
MKGLNKMTTQENEHFQIGEFTPFSDRPCHEAEFGVTRHITVSDFGKLVALGLAAKVGGGRSTRYQFKASGDSLGNRKGAAPNRKPPDRDDSNFGGWVVF